MTTPTTQAATTDAWTTRRLLAWIGEAFGKKGLDSPRLSAEILVAHVLKCDRLKLYLDQDRPASNAERDRLRDLVGRALKHEPLQYLVGEWPLLRALDAGSIAERSSPRPCTELIVERLIQHVRAAARGAKELPTNETPAPPRAALGEGVAHRRCVHGIRVHRGCTRQNTCPVAASSRAIFHPKRSNSRERMRPGMPLPTASCFCKATCSLRLRRPARADSMRSSRIRRISPITNGAAVPSNVKDHEPTMALRGGADGLQFVRPLIAHAPRLLKPGGTLLVEIASSTADAVLQLAQGAFGECAILQDHEGLPRVLEAKRHAAPPTR
jgi:release factor glutamine methyltransferase